MLLDALKKVLETGRLEEILSSGVKFHRYLSQTLLDRSTLRKEAVVARYLDVIGEIKRLVRDVVVEASDAGVAEAELYSRLVVGEVVYGSACMPVVLKRHLGLRGGVARPGAVVCIEPEKAAKLVLADIAEPVESGIKLGSTAGRHRVSGAVKSI